MTELIKNIKITLASKMEDWFKDKVIKKLIETYISNEKKSSLTDVSDTLILTPKDAEVFFNEIMNPKDANEALKKAMLKFITR